MDKFRLYNFGPVKSAEIEFGDLTFLVGPQASGKSFFLQAWKLHNDLAYIKNTFKAFGQNYANNEELVQLYYGLFRSELGDLSQIISYETNSYSSDLGQIGNIFYIPALRSQCLFGGRPKTYLDFPNEFPYVTKHFSYILHYLFNQQNIVDGVPFTKSIYHGGQIYVDKSLGKSELRMIINGADVSYSSWSTGQSEYAPLCIALQGLRMLGRSKSIVIEEPELGLHPYAIIEFIVKIIELINNGYKIIISTHSTVFLDFVWFVSKFNDASKEEFDKYVSQALSFNIKDFNFYAKRSNIKTYFFKDGVSKDISTLDAMSDDNDIADWGGITDFSTKISDILSDYKANREDW